MRSAETIAENILANVENLYREAISPDRFRITQRRLWNEAEANGTAARVKEIILQTETPNRA